MTDDATVLHPPLRLRLRAGLRKPANWLALVRFALVGASGYVVNLAVFALAVHALGVDYRVAAVLAFTVAVTNNFWLEPALDVRRPRRACRLPGRALPGRLARRLRRQPWDPHRPGRAAPSCPTRRRAGDRDRGRHAAGLRRQQALELPAADASRRGGRGDTRRAGPRARRRTPTSSSQPSSLGEVPKGFRLTGAEARAIAARDPKVARGPPHASARLRERLPEGRRALAGLVLQRPAPAARDRAGLRRRRERPGHRVVDRLPGRLDDGARLSRGVRAQRSTRPGCGSRCRCSSSCPSSTRAARGGCCTSTCSCSPPSASRSPSSTTRTSTSRCRSSTRCSRYLLARMLWIGLRRAGAARAVAPARARRRGSRSALVFLVGFRIGLNVTNSNVIDVGYAGVIGADRLVDGKRPLRGRSRPTTSTATPTARSPTRPTCRSSRPGRGAAPGTTCRRRTPRRSRSTCSA